MRSTLQGEVQMPTNTERSTPSPDRGRTRSTRGRRYEPVPIYRLAERLQRQGAKLHKIPGPWHPTRCTLRRPGRNAERTIPIVTNGLVEIAVDTAEHAVNLSGFLNSAGLDSLDPIPNLRPPDQDIVRD
jgi:hypothetical protein